MSRLVVVSFLATSLLASAQNRPPAYMEVFRAASEALANRDTLAFLDQFDSKMPQYEKLGDQIQELFGRREADDGAGLAAEDRQW